MEDFFFMIWTGIVEQNVADHYHQSFPTAKEFSGEWGVRRHIDMSFTDPLPKSLLRGPEVLIVVTNDPSIFLYFHTYTLTHIFGHKSALRGTPCGEATRGGI